MQRLIYGLIDPMTREIRCVGSSTKGLLRPHEHLRPCAYHGSQRRIHCWIRESLAAGFTPEIVVLEYVPDDAMKKWWEVRRGGIS